MAEIEDDYDDDYYYDDDYLYVEDSYALADELAEDQFPPAPAVEYLDEDIGDYDLYDYWMDIEYGTDEYYDVRIASDSNTKQPAVKSGQKRKVRNEEAASDNVKRRKVSMEGHVQIRGMQGSRVWRGPNVVWSTGSESAQLVTTGRDFKARTSYSLLPDWKTMIKSVTSPDTHMHSDQAMRPRPAPSSRKKKATPKQRVPSAEDPETIPDAPDLGPIVAMIQDKISASGVDGSTAHMLQEALAGMLKDGTGSLDEVVETMTGSLLERVEEEGEASGVAQWLTSRGVRMNAGEDAEQEAAGDREGQDEAKGHEPGEQSTSMTKAPALVSGNGKVTRTSRPPQSVAETRSEHDGSKLATTQASEAVKTNGKPTKPELESHDSSAGEVKVNGDPAGAAGSGSRTRKRKATEEGADGEQQPAKVSRSTTKAKNGTQKKAPLPERSSTRTTRSKK